jgi:hypothetical protein
MQESQKNGTSEPCDERAVDNPSWAEDQSERPYYYDDSHGYETYIPDDEDNDGDEEPGLTSL